jgi:O-antigen/teichoic acid export membrane protein
VSVVLLFQCDKVVIGGTVGAEGVTPYALVGQVFITAYGFFMLFQAPLWPAYADALRRGDGVWVRRSIRVSLALGSLIVITCGIALLAAGDYIIARWSRHQVTHVSHALTLALTATFLMRVWVDCRSVALNAAGALLPQTAVIGAHAAANLVLAVSLGRRFGVEGVAWATPITAVLTSGWGYPWMVRRFVLKPSARSARECEARTP